ncbi:MAG TPA: hypothetical protein VNH18_22510 [Bryobacteraceae bacterium]|nr:hypothetical protein [Bryobacteraceae bacterium]
MRRLLLPSLMAVLVLTGCSRLPRSLRNEISAENDKLEQARKDLAKTEATVKEDLARSPDLFNGTNVATEWPARLGVAKSKLDRADAAQKQIEAVAKSSSTDANRQIEDLLADQHRLRQSAIDESSAIVGEANRWLDFQRNLPHYLAKMNEAHQKLGAVDVAPVAQLVEKTERDWPGKKNDLDSRLNALRSAPERAESQWQASAAAREAATAGKATGPQIATLIAADNALNDAVAGTTTKADEVKALSGQLYDSWDKILEDLEVSDSGPEKSYREKLKTVRTHYTDVPLKKTEISSDSRWVDVSPTAYRNVEKDLGMAIAHKDAGLYDSEATTVAQPAGFAYMAPPGQSNQYGYWSAGPSGSMWTWLPQYLIMRELLWGRNYQPIYINEYNGYSTALRSGRSYYGTETPQAAPKYGTHGTFTQQNYASSRYVQSGGYKSSSFDRQSGSQSTRPGGATTSAPDAGKRFGNSPDAPEAGKRFGAPGNGDRSASPSSPPSGRRFGSPGGSRPSAGRSFGRRR